MAEYLFNLRVDEFRADIKRIVAEVIRESASEGKPKENPTYSTRKQVKDRLHISLPTLNRLKHDEILVPYKIGGRVLYLDDEVDAVVGQFHNLKYRRKGHAR